MLLASIGLPKQESESFDRHTGRQILIVRTVADAMAAARLTGNVATALEQIRTHREEFPEDPILARLEAVFAAELAAPLDPPSPAHPEANVLAAEQERARRLRKKLARRASEKLDPQTLLGLLQDLEADSAVRAATESFFQPLSRWRVRDGLGPSRPDELAARARSAHRIEFPTHPKAFLTVAAAFRSQARGRARIRWLLDAYAAFPDAPELQDLMIETYLEHQRILEALLVTGTSLAGNPENLELWELRARLAGWLSYPEVELEAREKLLATNDDPETRKRIVTLYTSSGRPEKAVPHARILARGSKDPKILEWPAQLALEGGDVDGALDILTELAARPGEEVFWREKIIDYAAQDLRVDRVVAELAVLFESTKDEKYDARLEDVFVRTHRLAGLALLLDARLKRRPDDEKLEDRLMRLHSALGNIDRVRALMANRLQRKGDARTYFANIGSYRRMNMPKIVALAPAMAAMPSLERKDVSFVFSQLQPHLDVPACRDAATMIANRFPDHPESIELLVFFADKSSDDDAGRARNARQLFLRNPDNDAYLKAWRDRASWAGETKSEIEARELWFERHGADDDNRRALAHLYASVNRGADALPHWQYLANKEGPGSEATLRLIDSLFAAERYDEAMAWLEKRAVLPESTVEDRLHVADQLFANELFDRALRFYMAVLDTNPSHPDALLRAGQIRSWTNDPRGAIPFFERRLAASDDLRAEVRYYVGEAYWAIQDAERGRRFHDLALADFEALAARTAEQDVMVAKMYVRVGRIEEARPIFERILLAQPRNADIVLDYADSMLAIEDVPKARELVDRAKALAPERGRTMQLDGKLLILEKHYEEAAKRLAESVKLNGPDAGTLSELGRAHDLAGDWRPSHEAYVKSIQLQPDNRDVARAKEAIFDRVAKVVHGNLSLRRAGDDSLLELWGRGTMLLSNERTRVAAALGLQQFSGRAAAVDDGATDLEESVFRLRVAGFRRFERRHRYGAGLDIYAGAPGDLPVGFWADVAFATPDPYRLVHVRIHINMLLEDPTAAVALGGRTSGLTAVFTQDMGKGLWVTAQAAFDYLSLDRPGGGGATDTRVRGAVSVGWRVIEGHASVADPIVLDRSTLPGLIGTHLTPPPEAQRDSALSVWLSLESIRLLDDAELAALIPIGESFDYLTIGARGDIELAKGWGAKLEGYAGADLGESGLLFGIEAGATWRPASKTELTAVFGYGTAAGRDDDTNAFVFRLGVSIRW